jgi:hypothetical protein
MVRLPARLMLAFACSSFAAIAALADPPPNADPVLAPWFQSQKVPGTAVSCCDVSDGRAVDYRIRGDHYEVYLTKESFPWIHEEGWKAVDPRSVLTGQDNPTGRAIAWVAKNEYTFHDRYFAPGSVMCFKPPSQV